MRRKRLEKQLKSMGTYDINTWYSYNNNTKTEVVTERVEYNVMLLN